LIRKPGDLPAPASFISDREKSEVRNHRGGRRETSFQSRGFAMRREVISNIDKQPIDLVTGTNVVNL